MEALLKSNPKLAEFLMDNKHGEDKTIDFADSDAVRTLNQTLLKHHYGIEYWDIRDGYLCPPIPGRADYIHYAADLLAKSNKGIIPKGAQVRCLDVGVGASCVYPIIGNREYGWSFVGSDVNPVSLKIANTIIKTNSNLRGKIELRLQERPTSIFMGVLKEDEYFDICICNPPFHNSVEEAEKANLRKNKNLHGLKTKQTHLNFGGQHAELWCEGGEKAFVKNMIIQSNGFPKSFGWFSTLISKESNLPFVYKILTKIRARDVQTIDMGQGNKKSRIVAWRF